MKLKFLLADDEPEIREIISELINEHFNCEIRTASNGNEAFCISVEEKFDLIITDHRMPESTGAEFINEIRENEWPNHLTPVILLSGFGEEAKLVLSKLDNVFFIDKTRYQDKLIPYIKMILSNKKLP